VGWWPFNGNANDESGNGNDGVVNGATLTEDRNGVENAAYSFDGYASEIDVLNNFISLGSDFTVSCWMSTTDLFKIQQCLFNSIGHTGFAVELNNENIPPNKLMYGVGPSNAFWDLIYAQGTYSQFQNNSWYHVLFEKTGTTYILYVNTILDGSSVVSASANYTLNVGIRFGSIGGSEFFKGRLDDIAIYNRALTEAEIQNLYTGTTPAACLNLPANLQDGLVGYWPFCGNANDESGNGNDGAVNGATLTEDRFGNAGSAYSFDGDDVITMVNSNVLSAINNASELTVSFWATDEGGGGERSILSSYTIPTGGLYLVNGYYGSSEFGVAISPTGSVFNTPVSSPETFHHFVVSYNGSATATNERLNVFVDGVESAISYPYSVPSQLGAGASSLFFGARHSINLQPIDNWNGLLDDITIYNRAFSPDEVAQLYAVQSTGDLSAGSGYITSGPLANVPRGISYQAVARDAQGQAIASSPVNVRFTLHEGTPSGTAEYSETHSLTTNEIGLFSTYFGSGTAITSAFDSIVWSNTTKFLQVEIDLGNGYVDMGTQQLMSVPFSYRANEAAAAGTIRNNALPVYTDNAAALAGGLVAGEMYRTATGDLKVVY